MSAASTVTAISPLPDSNGAEEDFELCRRDSEIKRRVLYEGVDASEGKRY
jgi:hypothetical protein